eukprot:285402_1
MSSESPSWYYRSYIARAAFGSAFIAAEYYSASYSLEYFGNKSLDYYSLFVTAPFVAGAFRHIYAIYKPSPINGLKEGDNPIDGWDMMIAVPSIIRSAHLAVRYIQDKRISWKEKTGLLGYILFFGGASSLRYFCNRGSNAWVICSIVQAFCLHKSVRLANYQKTPSNIIDNALVVLICVRDYDDDERGLPGTKLDKKNVTKLFHENYNFDVICNKNDRFTKEELWSLLKKARNKFIHGDYKSIIMIFSGHGNENISALSDHTTMSRVDIESYFSIEKVKSKAEALRLYFIDSCRGSKHSYLVKPDRFQFQANANLNYVQSFQDTAEKRYHPDENRCVFYSNTEPYYSYDDEKNGGILIYSLCKVLTDNENVNLLELQDLIRKYAKSKVTKVDGQLYVSLVEIKSTVNNRKAQKTVFRKNTLNDSTIEYV